MAVAAGAWVALIVWGGAPSMRLGVLTGGAALPSMTTHATAMSASMPGMHTSPPPAAQHTSVTTAMPANMPGMHMAPAPAAHQASVRAAATHATSAPAMKMTMFGVSISGVDHAFSWPMFGLFMLMWMVMIAAMMLLVVLPMSVRYHRVATRQGQSRWRTAGFVLGDLSVWLVVGIPAYLALVGLEELFPATGATAIRWAAVLVAAAGAYEFTSLKHKAHERTCTAHAAELRFAGNQDATRKPLRTGFLHGLASLECCGPVMGVLLLVGMMNILWMVGLTAVMFFERTVPWGHNLSRAVGVALVVAAVVLLAVAHPLPALV